MSLHRGDRGQSVKDIQNVILSIDANALPRFGADGDLGTETLSAAADILEDFGYAHEDDDKDELSDAELDKLRFVAGIKKNPNPKSANWIDARGLANATKRKKRRSWGEIDSIVIHQTDCVLGSKPQRWSSVPIHFGVTRAGEIIQLHDLEWLLYHAHSLNGSSIGIEIDGQFPGVEGDLKTFNTYGVASRKPLQMTEPQITAVKALLGWIVAELARHGGKIKNCWAHRQGTNTRRGDPGSRTYKEIVLWAEKSLGLNIDFNFVKGKGQPIPTEWNPASPHKY